MGRKVTLSDAKYGVGQSVRYKTGLGGGVGEIAGPAYLSRERIMYPVKMQTGNTRAFTQGKLRAASK